MTRAFLGEFEQMVLLAILRVGDEAYGLEVRRELERAAGRTVSRGGFYTTLDRLERKGLVRWVSEVPKNARRESRQRRFSVTPAGTEALKTSRRALITLWDGLEPVLED
jgi:DNA-binding PadR family transcriptional regulator